MHKDPYEPKYRLLMNKRKSIYSKHCNDSIAFIEYFMTWITFIKTLMNTMQIKNLKN